MIKIDPILFPYFASWNDTFVKGIERVWASGNRVLLVTKSDQVYGINATSTPAIMRTSEDPLHMMYTSASSVPHSEPKQLFQLHGKNVIDFIFGGDFIIALTKNGELFSWGGNQSGQLGLGDRPYAPHPIQISTLSDKTVTKVVCGKNTAMALCDDGQVFCWGESWGFIPVKCTAIQNKATDIAILSMSASSSLSYYYFCVEDGKIKSTTMEGSCWLNDIKSIVCSEHQILALKNDGSLYSTTWYATQGPLMEDHFIAIRNIPKVTEIYAASKMIAENYYDEYTDDSRFNMCGAKTENNEIYIWGTFRGRINTPLYSTSYSSFNEVVLMYSNFRLTHRAFMLGSVNKMKNTHCDCLKYISTIFDDESKNSDFIIVVEQIEIFVHRAILRQRSKYFEDKLAEPGNENDENVLHVKDFTYKAFKLFLQYLYGIDINVTRENVMELIIIAHQYSDEKFENLIMEKIADDEKAKMAIPAVKNILELPPEVMSIAMRGVQFKSLQQ
ncbi:RCC1 and BTB domain-containing protein 1-like [Planococcus citri]|uniref:RCC1 and BTB domain-containing protein 1-like n=1 Tax=Planococcus citri TaxID=170843 RepID=UPI0031F744A7